MKHNIKTNRRYESWSETQKEKVPPGFEPRLAELSHAVRIRCDNQLHYGTGDIRFLNKNIFTLMNIYKFN